VETASPVKFSIVTVCMNCRDELAATLASIRAQTYSTYESIVIDGGSRDGTVEVIESARDWLTYAVSEQDSGIFEAMNKGARQASGDYIIFMNAGDRFASADVLEALVRNPVVRDKRAAIVSGRVQFEIGGQLCDYYRPRKPGPEGLGLPHQATFIKAKLQQDNPFDERFRIVGDYEFWRRLQAAGAFDVHYTGQVIAVFGLGGASSGGGRSFARSLEGAYVNYLYSRSFDFWDWLAMGTKAIGREVQTWLLRFPRLYFVVRNVNRSVRVRTLKRPER
jgi:glycosyltransferase involved in cell wall biosynthesis